MRNKIVFYLLVFDAIFIPFIFFYLGLEWYVSILPFVFIFFFILICSAKIQLNFFVKSVNHGSRNSNTIYLTFDDGPHPLYTPQVLDLLKNFNAKASFFLIGQHAEKFPDLVSRISEEGHTVGNHSFTHSDFIDFKNAKGWSDELEKTNEVIFKIIGKLPKFFRPPFGVTTPHLATALQKTKMISIGWDIRTYDTVLKNPKKINYKIQNKIKPGSIILLHDTHEQIILILEQLLTELAQRNFKFESINQQIDEKIHAEF